MDGESASLNPNQQRRLRVTCEYVDGLLSDIETILKMSASKSPFSKYANDISPAQRRTIEDHIARIRAQLLRVLQGQNIETEPPRIPASRALQTSLNYVDIAVEELRPRYMKGYGNVPPAAAAELNAIVEELQVLVKEFDRHLRQATGEDQAPA